MRAIDARASFSSVTELRCSLFTITRHHLGRHQKKRGFSCSAGESSATSCSFPPGNRKLTMYRARYVIVNIHGPRRPQIQRSIT